MNIKTKAFLPFSIIPNSVVTAVDEIHLRDNELISLTLSSAKEVTRLIGASKRQQYEIKFLDKYHNNIYRADQYAEIIYTNNNGEKESVYIKINWYDKWKLKWMNKIYGIQKNSTIWIPVIISTTIALLGMLFQRTMEPTEKSVKRIDSLQGEQQLHLSKLALDISRIDSILNDSIKKVHHYFPLVKDS